MKKIFGLLIILMAFSTNVYAEELKSIEPTKEQKEIEQIIIQAEFEARNETYEELGNKTINSLLKLDYIEDSTAFKETVREKIDEKIEKYGIKRLDEDKPPFATQAVSPPTTAIDIKSPSIYSSSQGYVIMGSAVWKKRTDNNQWTWKDHGPLGFGSAVSVGGADGLGIYFQSSQNINITKSSFYTHDENGNSYNTNLYPYQNNANGVYYVAQDYMQNTTFNPFHSYTWHSATITIWPSYSGTVNTTARTHWTHTWSTGKITGATISGSGISVSISGSSHAWDGVSNTGTSIKY